MHTRLRKLPILIAALLASPLALLAAEAPAAGTSGFMNLNPVLIGLVSLVVILLFAIGIVGNVLRQLSLVYRDKMRADRVKKTSGPGLKSILLLAAISLFAGTAYAQAEATEAAAAAATSSPYISGIPRNEFYVLLTILVLEVAVLLAMIGNIRMLLGLMREQPELHKAAKAIVRRRSIMDRLNNSVELEQERDIVLDHDYDGIRELDNNLPPWWKYGFYLTIVISVMYLWYYHVGDGPSQHDEFVAAMQKGEEEKAAYLAGSANNVDESTVVMLSEAADIAAGRSIYESSCAACHAKDGGGGVGPNLTDDYWLHGGSISDVFKSIKYGWQDKGMKAWQNDFSPRQIAQISSFVKSMRGSKPAAPKEQQGDLFIEATDGGAAADSSKPVMAQK